MQSSKITIPDVVERFAAYYSLPENGVWGSLHSVLDDHNVRNHDVEWCIERATERGDTEGLELAKLLLLMSKTQRLGLPGAVDKYIAENQSAASMKI